MLWQIVQAIFLLLFAFTAYKFAKAYQKQREKEAEGVKFSGPFAFFMDSITVIMAATQRPNELFIELFHDKIKAKHGGTLPPTVGMHMFGTMGVFFNEPKAVEELFLTKNAFFSKHEIER